MEIPTEVAEVYATRREYRQAILAVYAIVRSLPPTEAKLQRGVVRCGVCRSALVEAWPDGDQTLILPTEPKGGPPPESLGPDANHPDEDDPYWHRPADFSDLNPWPLWALRGHHLDPARTHYEAGCRCTVFGGAMVPWTEIAASMRVRGRVVVHKRDTPRVEPSA